MNIWERTKQKWYARKEVDYWLKQGFPLKAIKAYREVITPMPSLADSVGYMKKRRKRLGLHNDRT